MERNIVKLQGLPVDTFSFDDAMQYAQENHGQVITINPEMIASARKNKDFAHIINDAELIVPDGIGVEIGLKILGYNVRRIAGVELARKLIDTYTKNKKSIALVGAKPEVIEKTISNLKSECPEINIVYVQDGYFKDEERVLEDLKNAKPDLLLTALGSPKQEVFNYRVKKLLPDTLAIGVGGSFDVWSGMVKRAPVFWQKAGLEWLYRTIKDPKRFKRIFPTLPLFVINVLQERIFRKV